jgi:L-malate glycosyltransferase
MIEPNLNDQKKKVAIVFTYVHQYRADFYSRLKKELNKRGVEFILIYGQPSKVDALKGDMVDIPWGNKIKNYIFPLWKKELYWQPVFPFIKDVDLVIVEPGSRLLVNYLLLIRSFMSSHKLAFWGFGLHFHTSKAIPISEWVKRVVTKRVHWYFAYTDRVVDIVHNMGFPVDRITVVNNSIDTKNLIEALEHITDKELVEFKHRLGLKGDHVGLYIGAMYKEKKLEFLLDSCKLIRQRVPDFEMLIIGAGPDANLVKAAESENPWIHYLGPKFKEEKVPFFAISKLVLLPGSVGLAILDSFSLGVPIVTTQNPDQAPELDYLIDGVNGVLVKDNISPSHYAQVVSDLITNDNKLSHFVKGCRDSAKKYTIENMVSKFTEGVMKAIRD